ncbi:hypothetical protein [Propionicimonas sp.]|uniref:hypothetical protein n=1 Tax=Propionicimonas sp. TaxID=1955623 RepID=UPI0017D1429A|nr:hypothetical protein [Propionicimonas sp.]MBU3976279.1 hypothetical protein [Actinomycetota bacterium]MBA3022127.1 hypothetical protein [Propionicimonas sp.]MBU3987436.1 hypothetical protein [Actinomycetota bacterium]MBU4006619.1 hypothetical protein [Actinomycetota bacterium]MBU4065224.1 hypothetical protein [Actinomycetota bacterium]
MGVDVRLRVARLVAAGWPEARPYRRDQFGDYSVYRALNGVNQRCWLFTDDDGELHAVLIVGLVEVKVFDLNIRFRASKPPLAGLVEDEVAAYLIDLARDLDTPQKIKSLTWDEATRKSARLAERVPFNALARMHFQACVASGQDVTERLVDKVWLSLEDPCQKWQLPDVVAQENGWDENKPLDYGGNILGVALNVALRERDQLRAEIKVRMGSDQDPVT